MTSTGKEDLIGVEVLRERLARAGAPADLLELISDAKTPQEALELMSQAESSGDESPQESLLRAWTSLTEPGAAALEAELTGYEMLAMIASPTSDDAELANALTGIARQIGEYDEPEALLMLRTLAAIGPHQAREAIENAADTVAAEGITGPAWLNDVGKPKYETSFGYAVDLQESIVLVFRYGRKKHAVVILIDHGLGGGIKDCWVADRPTLIRSGYQDAAREAGVRLHTYSVAEALEILNRTLARKPCPAEDDQIDDVNTYLDLLRNRLPLMS